jgi:hypothetical protein
LFFFSFSGKYYSFLEGMQQVHHQPTLHDVFDQHHYDNIIPLYCYVITGEHNSADTYGKVVTVGNKQTTVHLRIGV